MGVSPRSTRLPLAAQQGEALGVTLLTVDALPAAQQGLTPESRRFGRPGRCHVPRLDEQVEARDGEFAEGEGHHGAQRPGRQALAPGLGQDPVADRGPPALYLAEPQPDGPEAPLRLRGRGQDERVAVAQLGPPVLALDESRPAASLSSWGTDETATMSGSPAARRTRSRSDIRKGRSTTGPAERSGTCSGGATAAGSKASPDARGRSGVTAT